MTRRQLDGIHALCSSNRKLLRSSKTCGCFYCMRIFAPKEIKEYHYDPVDQTALCPHCGIDSVLPDRIVAIDHRLLKAMNVHFFSYGTSMSGKEWKELGRRRAKAMRKLTKSEKELLFPKREDGPVKW